MLSQPFEIPRSRTPGADGGSEECGRQLLEAGPPQVTLSQPRPSRPNRTQIHGQGASSPRCWSSCKSLGAKHLWHESRLQGAQEVTSPARTHFLFLPSREGASSLRAH